MFVRIVSLFQIAAIIACPLSCGSGMCHDGKCCADDGCADEECVATEQCLTAVCPKHAVPGRSCCDQSSDSRDERPADPCPGQSSCQGVCGGAVFEKHCELNSADTFFVPLPGNDRTFISLLSVGQTDGVAFPEFVGSGNPGRFVRTVHMSWKC